MKMRQKTIQQLLVFIFFALFAVYFAIIWKNSLVWQQGNLVAGHPFIWADWSMHLPMIAAFAWKNPGLWFANNPIYAGAPLNYPFVANLISGLLWHGGLPLTWSTALPSYIFTLGLLFALYAFWRQELKARIWPLIAILLFLCSGGLGFVLGIKQPELLLNPAAMLTQIEGTGIVFTNIFVGMLLPQRAFLLGMPLGVMLLGLVFRLSGRRKAKPVHLGLGGVMAGLLPIIHTHTYIVLVLMSAWLFLWSYRLWRRWAWFVVPAMVVSLVVYIAFLRGTPAAQFFSWHPGWMADPGLLNWLLFWIKNWGVFLFLAIGGTYLAFQQKQTRFTLINLGWWLIFGLANLIQFQPQMWDNSKLLAWVYFGLIPAALYPLFKMWNRRQAFSRLLVLVLVVLTCLSGAVDLVHILDAPTHSFTMISADEFKVSEYVRERVPESAVILTADGVASPPIMLSGRSIIMGYPGWAFSYGFPISQRVDDIPRMYAGGSIAETLIDQYHISYVYLGNAEMKYVVNRAYFASHYPLAFAVGDLQLYKVR